MKYYIAISRKGQSVTTIEVNGAESAWEKFSMLAEILEGLAAVQLIDGKTTEIIASNEENFKKKIK